MASGGKNTIAGDELRAFVERVENIRAHKRDLAEDEKLVMAEASAAGFLPKAIRHCVKLRAMKPQDREEAETVIDTYLHALGMDTEPPAHRIAAVMDIDRTSREQVLEAFMKAVPDTGDIIVRIGGEPVRLWRDKDGDAQQEPWAAPSAPSYPENARPSDKPPRPKAEVPDVDADGAVELGRQYAKDNLPVIENPFPYGDPRRAKFDEGWRAETGGDGMGPDD